MDFKSDPIGSTVPPPKHFRLYNSLFMVGYLPNWLIYLKHFAHRESSSYFAALIPALLVTAVQREGWSTGADERGKVTRTIKG